MSAEVVRLPTATPSFYRIRRSGRWWLVELVTPSSHEGVRPLRTVLARSKSFDVARQYIEPLAAELQRPLKLPQRVQP